MINYPNKKIIKNEVTNSTSNSKKNSQVYNAANRGMDLEKAINISNSYYDDEKRAIITKRPTPIHVVKVDYAHGCRITDAYFEKQSTTDYNGVYRGKYIDFECKETQSSTSFSLNNISSHQIKHLKKVLLQGGIAFFLIYFKKKDEVFLIDSSFIIDRFENSERKTIPYSDFLEHGYIIEQGFIPRLKYLDVVDKVYFNETK